ncbi:agamous-like MADS-box protein AGL15 [Lycium barbarum]|uniref:agamous-like MADS-box protein AGL15 n=1 Tax=Lycium barbarum TaxID=112863 RepID=UPI00293F025B|nr:agamous-like MADS-box protein AGL15 [Lycium barbarum]
MGKRKIEIERIENTNSRQVTFSKRRQGLIRKANALAILCDVEVGIIVFSTTGKLYEFASSSMEHILARYNRASESIEDVDAEPEVNAFRAEIVMLRHLQRRIMRMELEGLNFKELQLVEHQLTECILAVNKTKEQALLEKLEKSLLQTEKVMVENAAMREEIEELKRSSRINHESVLVLKNSVGDSDACV